MKQDALLHRPFFFFQAEDGIRDGRVTGVQTCALPILKAMLDQILRQLPVDSAEHSQEAELEPLIAMGEQVLAEGDAERALSVFEQIAEMARSEERRVGKECRCGWSVYQ